MPGGVERFGKGEVLFCYYSTGDSLRCVSDLKNGVEVGEGIQIVELCS